MRNYVITTPLLPIWSKKSATALFVPLTGPINTAMVNKVRVSRNLLDASETDEGTYEAAYQMSDDGITWSATITGLMGGTFTTTTGWAYNQGTAATVSTDIRNFVRFGIQVKNLNDSTEVEQVMAQLQIEVEPTNGRTITAGPMKVCTDGTVVGTAIFNPMTDPIPIETVGEIRASVEMQSESGDCNMGADPSV